VHVSGLNKHNNNYKTAVSSQEHGCLIVVWHIMFIIPSLFSLFSAIFFFVAKSPRKRYTANPTPRQHFSPPQHFSRPNSRHPEPKPSQKAHTFFCNLLLWLV
jgi:hypothetical protein